MPIHGHPVSTPALKEPVFMRSTEQAGVVFAERQRLARDLHDDVAQLLAALQMDLAMLKRNLGGYSQGTADLLDSMQTIADLSVVSIRRVIGDLRPPVLDDAGLVRGIESLADDARRRFSLRIVVSVSDQVVDLSDGLVTTVYRVIQESLNNVAKHAQASTVEIAVIAVDDVLTVRVRDDGIGLSSKTLRESGGFGLCGMRERVTLLGGEFLITSSPGEGTEVVAVLPISFPDASLEWFSRVESRLAPRSISVDWTSARLAQRPDCDDAADSRRR